VADRFAKNDSFILMVLDVCGRVRPADLHGVPHSERESAIASFYERHATNMNIYFEGDALVEIPRPSATPALVPPAQTPVPPPRPPSDSSPQPAPPGAGPSAALDPVRPAALDPPLPAVGLRPADDHALDPEPILGATDEELALIGDAVEFVPEEAASAPVADPPSPRDPMAPRSPVTALPTRKPARQAFHLAPWMWWWAPTLLVPAFGGVAAWMANRKKRAAQARAMLIVGLLIGAIAAVGFLANAESLAGFFVRTTEKQVIVLPTTKAVIPDPASDGSATESGTESKQ